MSTDKSNQDGRHPLSCDICGQNFSSKFNLKLHLESHGRCDICQKTFKYQFHLERHMVVHEPESKFKCNTCQKSYKHQISLWNHNAKSHQSNPEVIHTCTFQCNICERGFKGFRMLYRHVRTVHKSNSGLYFLLNTSLYPPFHYNTFGNKYREQRYLSTHMWRSHPFECSICGKRYPMSRDLEEHMLTHSNPNQNHSFVCEKCKKSFCEELDLMVHNELCLPANSEVVPE